MIQLKFFKIASSFYLVFAKGRTRRGFLILNLPVGNITLCREQHLAGELRVESRSNILELLLG
jgi:hypothetical protein